MEIPTKDTAENPFGDVSLFQQFDENEADSKLLQRSKVDSDGKDRLLADLKRENEDLKQRIRLLEPPREGKFFSSEDSPVVQVIFMHHDRISKKRQVVEDFFQKLVSGIETDDDKSSHQLLPQRSSVRIKGSNVTFLATGNVQYYTNFCLDIIGRPLIDGDIALTEDWEIPSFSRGFPDPLPLDEDAPRKSRPSRPKACCFNCGDEGHSLRDCPIEPDYQRINAKKQEFRNNSSPSLNSKRYHKDAESDNRFTDFKAGIVSDELRKALGLQPQDLPDYIYRMRALGYPPGYLLEAEVTSSGLAVYDKLRDEEGEIKDAHDISVKYNPERLIKYPGFNVTVPAGVVDDWQYRNMPPMQPHHDYEVFRSVMGKNQSNNDRSKKRKGEFNEDVSKRKKSRVQEVKEMEICPVESPSSSSDPDSRGFWLDDEDTQGSPFRPPLPPSPYPSELPPIPSSTPPDTPNRTPNHTPKDTPLGSLENTPVPSPSVSSSDGIYPSMEMEGSGLSSPSLDDLVSQQKQLLSTLSDENPATISDSNIVVEKVQEGTQENEVGSSQVEGTESSEPGDSMSMHTNTEDGDREEESTEKSEEQRKDEDKQSNDVPSLEDKIDSTTVEEGEQPNKSGVPHRKNFAEGITPHVDENVSASKGVFKKILGLLKISKDKSS
ncbi:Zinc finger CCHC domain-containing protein 8 [Holothuria leucospilota]|uniref:Zinc finger CCHC domain-containing protein 8 n=1 Tax=Holothuria leucospilota TaxID=206669 RepID=A0A9Q1CDI4_HOLLE|nr:Zinc finger CCHC domain-containing protein 8 [Holothuria leucospilota]